MARREVAVDLILRAAQYLREGRSVLAQTMATTRAVDELGDKADATGRDMDQLAAQTEIAKHQVDDLGDKARTTAASMALLQSRITASRAAVRGLAMDFATADDAGAASALSREQAKLRRLERAAKVLTPEAGEGFLSGIPAIGGVPGPAVAGLGAAAVALTPVIGATIAAAVLGSVGTGGLIGGILLASKDTRVKEAWKTAGQEIFTDLGDAASPFVAPLQRAAGQMREAFGRELPGFRQDFAVLAKTVEPITGSLTDFIEEIHPGLSAAFKASVPVARQFRTEMKALGGASSGALDDMAKSSTGAKAGLHDLFMGLDLLISEGGDATKVLSQIYTGLSEINRLSPLATIAGTSDLLSTIGRIEDLAGGVKAYHRNLNEATPAAEGLNRALEDQAKAAKADADAFERVTKFTRDYFDLLAGRQDAAEHYEAAIDDLTESVKENGHALDIHTEQGRANRDALEDAARATKDMYDQGLLTDAQYQAQIRYLEDHARALGFDKDAVYKLIGAFEKLPKQIVIDALVKFGPTFDKLFSLMTFGGSVKQTAQQGRGGTDFSLTPVVNPPSHQQFLGFDSGGTTPAFEPFRVHAGETLWSDREHYVATAAQTRAITAGSAGGGTVRHVIDLRLNGRTVRTLAIDDALSRGVPETTIEVAYP